jgi:hypothetical protein
MAVSNVLDVVIGARRVWAPVGLLTFSGQFAAWFVPLLIITVWQAACSFGVLADSVLPSPAAVVAAGWHLTLSGDLPRNMEISLLRAITGLAVGGGIGFAFGLANGLSKISDRLTDSTLQMIRYVLRTRRYVADADRCGDDRRTIGHRLHGDAGARVHANRRRCPRNPDLCTIWKACRHYRACARAGESVLAPRVFKSELK